MTLMPALMLAFMPAPANADIADAECVGAMWQLEDQAADADKPKLRMAQMFFLGKISGRSGTSAIDSALKAAAGKGKATGGIGTIPAVVEQCIAEIQQISTIK